MSILKRWWWVIAAVVVVGAGAYLFLGRGAAASPDVASTPGTTATATPTPSVTPTESDPATSSPSDPSTTESGTPDVGKVKVAPKGTPLKTVTAPPQQTLARITYTASRDGQTYEARFQPYGVGPARAGHGTIAVKVTSFNAEKDYSDALKLPSNNVLLELGPGVSVTGGGTYSGVVKLMKSGDALVLVLTSVKAE